jgi:hypothetical protein
MKLEFKQGGRFNYRELLKPVNALEKPSLVFYSLRIFERSNLGLRFAIVQADMEWPKQYARAKQ